MPESKKQVLVVDDELHITTLLCAALKVNGYEVCTACDGVEALELIDLKHPDLILLDIQMPRMDGWQVCEKLKGQEATKDIPLIIVTAYGQKENREKSLKLGADDFITKPFEISHLIERVKKFLQK